MARSAHRFLLAVSLSLSVFVSSGLVRAHVPEKIVIDLELGEDSWVATSEMDIKFAVVALMHHYLPPDVGSGWLDSLNDGQLGLVREVTEKLYRERFELLMGDRRAEMSVQFPDYEYSPLQFGIGENDEPVVRVVMRGSYPAEEGCLDVRWNARWGPTLALLVRHGGESDPGVVTADLGERVEIGPRPGSGKGRAAPPQQHGQRSFQAGFGEILLHGTIHLLFLLGLLLLGSSMSSLAAQVAAFFGAHAAGFWFFAFQPPGLPVAMLGPLLAVTVIYVGIDNLFAQKVGARRLLVVAGFGLGHGLAFASGLPEGWAQAPDPMRVAVPFWFGLEIAQIAILTGGLLLVVPLLRSERWRKVRLVGSAVIVISGLFLFVHAL